MRDRETYLGDGLYASYDGVNVRVPRGELVSTVAGQFTLFDVGAGVAFQFHWIETLKGQERTMSAFVLATDAMQLFSYYQARETAEARDMRGGVVSVSTRPLSGNTVCPCIRAQRSICRGGCWHFGNSLPACRQCHDTGFILPTKGKPVK